MIDQITDQNQMMQLLTNPDKSAKFSRLIFDLLTEKITRTMPLGFK